MDYGGLSPTELIESLQGQVEFLTKRDDIAQAQIKILKNAIRKHQNAKGHDRCWENDLELYRVLGEKLPSSPELPPVEEFTKCCKQYYCQQAGIADENQMTILLGLDHLVDNLRTSFYSEDRDLMADAFEKDLCLMSLLIHSLHAGHQTFSYKRAEELGWMSYYTFKMFKKELMAEGVNWNEKLKKYR